MEIFGEDILSEPTQTIATEGIVAEMDPLKLDLDDKDFADVMDSLINESRKFFEKMDLKNRRKENVDYYLGRQTKRMEEENKLKKHNARYQDNVIYEAEGILKATAVSRVPDLLVKPGSQNPESEKTAETLTEVINNRMRKRQTRIVLGRAYKHRPLYFIGAIKCRWDSSLGRLGDYLYENVHPENIDMDHTATSNNVDDMSFVAHHYDLSIKEIIMKWPDKKKDVLELLGWEDEPGEKKLASKLKISEIWFTWYRKSNDKWIREEGVGWKYKKLVFDKIKNPYWDWEGETVTFTYDKELGKKRLSEADIRQAMTTGMPIMGATLDKIYHNHFEYPKKPFVFLGYDQLGMQPLDETSRIEQVKYLQDTVNLRGRQISDITSRSRGKDVYSTKSGLEAGDIQSIDSSNPDQALLLDGALSDVYLHIPGEQPSAALFQEQAQNRERLFSKMATNAALRGIREGPDPATKTQLFKESDFTRIDDEVEDTINAAAENMADWALQFIKLFYTQEHLEKIEGSNGRTAFMKITRDLIEDGVEVKVSASSVDKLRRKREAYELAGIQMTDPVTFFKDIEASDPEGRAERLILFQTNPSLYFEKYVRGNETTVDMANALAQQPVTPAVPPTGVEISALPVI